MLLNSKGFYETFLRFPPLNIITTHSPSSTSIPSFPFYFTSFSPLPRLIIFPLFKKLVGISILQIELKKMFREKKNPLMIRVAF